MIVTLVSLLLISAIFILFSSYWVPWVKRLDIPFALKLIAPMALVSWYTLSQEAWVDWGWNWIHWYVNVAAVWIKAKLAGHVWEQQGALVLLMTFIALLPTLFARMISKPYRPFQPPYWSSIYLWLILMLLVVLPYE